MKNKILTDIEKNEWMGKSSASLFVSKEYFHHHAFEIVNTFSDIKNRLSLSLSNNIPISPRIKKTKFKESFAIEATSLNSVIRNLLKNIHDLEIKFEVYEENGIFYFSSEKSSIGGFDFAILNHNNNLIALRNLCFGSLSYADGELRWRRFLEKNPELVEIANKLKENVQNGQDIINDDKQKLIPLIVGEIQFGNWALAYRDFFKVLKADVQNSIDCLIYIVPTGLLEAMLSDGIVTFDKTKKIIEDFKKVISVPIWLIGVDIDANENKEKH